MKRVLILSLAVVALVVMLPTPAQAVHRGTYCNVKFYNVSIDAQTCITVNQRDSLFPEYEALAWYNHGDAKVDFDWVHLYRWREGQQPSDGVLVRKTGSNSGWVGVGTSWSTNWYDGPDNGYIFQARYRWRIKWPNGIVTQYYKDRSYPWNPIG